MRHFGLDEWVDFARDVMEQRQKDLMQRHLESGCAGCQRILQTWQRVHEVARHDSAYEPPESAIRFVRGAFAIHGPHKVNSSEPLWARLVFDSFSSAMPVGVRSAGQSVRQLLFTGGGYDVDVHLEPQSNAGKAFIIGQVLASDPMDRTASGIRVALLDHGRILGQAVTNTFGEFKLEGGLDGSCELRFQPSRGSEFYISLAEKNVSDPASLSSSSITLTSRRSRRSKNSKKRV